MKRRSTFGREPTLAEIHGAERFQHDRRAESEERDRLRALWFETVKVALLDATRMPMTGAAGQERCAAARRWLEGGDGRDQVLELAGIEPETLDRTLPALRASWAMADAGHQPKRRHLAQVPFAWAPLAALTAQNNDLAPPVMRRMLAESAERTRN